MSPLDRRSFLTRSALVTGAAGAALATGARAAGMPGVSDGAPATPGAAVAGTDLAATVPFTGIHQAGILNPQPAAATLVAFDSVAPDRRTLAAALSALSSRARQLSAGGATPLLEADAPPADSGILGPANAPGALTVTISFGASLFDHRDGLASRRPAELIQMPAFPVDDLDPKICHGDVLVQICAQQRDTVVHTLRELARTVRGVLQQRWTMDGFSGANRGPSPKNSPRNLFAFRDGTGNPVTTDPELMNQLVWAGAAEPSLGRSSRIRATTWTPRANASRSTRTSAWPTRARRRRPTSGSCGAASATTVASTRTASWTRACCSWPTTGARAASSPSSRTVSTAGP